MIPFGHETVTLIRRETAVTDGRTQASYRKVILTGCSWRRSDELHMNGNGVIGSETVTCRIPSGQTKPRAGDLLILGNYAGTVSSAADFKGIVDTLKPDGGAFVVQSVTDNTLSGAPMPHWKAR